MKKLELIWAIIWNRRILLEGCDCYREFTGLDKTNSGEILMRSESL